MGRWVDVMPILDQIIRIKMSVPLILSIRPINPRWPLDKNRPQPVHHTTLHLQLTNRVIAGNRNVWSFTVNALQTIATVVQPALVSAVTTWAALIQWECRLSSTSSCAIHKLSDKRRSSNSSHRLRHRTTHFLMPCLPIAALKCLEQHLIHMVAQNQRTSAFLSKNVTLKDAIAGSHTVRRNTVSVTSRAFLALTSAAVLSVKIQKKRWPPMQRWLNPSKLLHKKRMSSTIKELKQIRSLNNLDKTLQLQNKNLTRKKSRNCLYARFAGSSIRSQDTFKTLTLRPSAE